MPPPSSSAKTDSWGAGGNAAVSRLRRGRGGGGRGGGGRGGGGGGVVVDGDCVGGVGVGGFIAETAAGAAGLALSFLVRLNLPAIAA